MSTASFNASQRTGHAIPCALACRALEVPISTLCAAESFFSTLQHECLDPQSDNYRKYVENPQTECGHWAESCPAGSDPAVGQRHYQNAGLRTAGLRSRPDFAERGLRRLPDRAVPERGRQRTSRSIEVIGGGSKHCGERYRATRRRTRRRLVPSSRLSLFGIQVQVSPGLAVWLQHMLLEGFSDKVLDERLPLFLLIERRWFEYKSLFANASNLRAQILIHRVLLS